MLWIEFGILICLLRWEFERVSYFLLDHVENLALSTLYILLMADFWILDSETTIHRNKDIN